LALILGLNLQDPLVYGCVRAGWQTMGQPAVKVDDNVIFVRCEPKDTAFSRLRNSVSVDLNPQFTGYGEGQYGDGVYGGASSGDITQSWIDVHTRTWDAIITIYGPNSLDNARAVLAGLEDVSYIDSFLAGYNLYVNPDIEQPRRVPENFQGEWWERMDILIEFNEKVTESFTVGTVGTVVVTTYDKDGQLTSQTITV
jgi:hypothetical protein